MALATTLMRWIRGMVLLGMVTAALSGCGDDGADTAGMTDAASGAVDAPMAPSSDAAPVADAILIGDAANPVDAAPSGDGGGAFCGGIAGEVCKGDQYCDYSDDNCGANDSGGVCTDRPQICQPATAQVCGCDGVTYDNVCYAAQAGTDIASTGACPP